MKTELKDTQDAKTCKSSHRLQWLVRLEGAIWQLCLGCDRRLFVR